MGWPSASHAASTIHAEQANAWFGNLGWVNWRPTPDDGVEVGEFVLAGHAYSANAGWIHFGTGNPADGVRYRNDSAADFGVNMDLAGNLRGLAYGANIGWISFESTGAPRLALETGRFSGYAYGANVGWINLGDSNFALVVETISAGTDRDGDGIPDGWELLHAADLTRFARGSDADLDGQTDLEEYRADTDPLDSNDRLQVVSFTLAPDKASARIIWTSKPSRHYRIQSKALVDPAQPWADLGPGIVTSAGNRTERTVSTGPEQEFFRVNAARPFAPTVP
jgi:hypothetical protein